MKLKLNVLDIHSRQWMAVLWSVKWNKWFCDTQVLTGTTAATYSVTLLCVKLGKKYKNKNSSKEPYMLNAARLRRAFAIRYLFYEKRGKLCTYIRVRKQNFNWKKWPIINVCYFRPSLCRTFSFTWSRRLQKWKSIGDWVNDVTWTPNNLFWNIYGSLESLDDALKSLKTLVNFTNVLCTAFTYVSCVRSFFVPTF
jgi:hypothetical protein